MSSGFRRPPARSWARSCVSFSMALSIFASRPETSCASSVGETSPWVAVGGRSSERAGEPLPLPAFLLIAAVVEKLRGFQSIFPWRIEYRRELAPVGVNVTLSERGVLSDFFSVHSDDRVVLLAHLLHRVASLHRAPSASSAATPLDDLEMIAAACIALDKRAQWQGHEAVSSQAATAIQAVDHAHSQGGEKTQGRAKPPLPHANAGRPANERRPRKSQPCQRLWPRLVLTLASLIRLSRSSGTTATRGMRCVLLPRGALQGWGR